MTGCSAPQAKLVLLALVANVLMLGCSRKTLPTSVEAEPPGVTSPVDEPVVELDRAKQKAIWDAEHVTFELEHRFGKAFLQAIGDRDKDQLAGFFRDNFQGTFGANAELRKKQHGFVEEAVATYDTAELTRADAGRMAEQLLHATNELATIQRSRFRVLKIQKTGEPAAWEIRVLLSFVGTQPNGQHALIESEHRVAVTIGEEDQIGYVPIVDSWHIESLVRRSSTGALMEEMTEQVGFHRLALQDNWKVPAAKASQFGFQFAAEDFDLDGDMDLAIAGYNKQTMLLRSRQGQEFQDVSREMGLGSRIAAQNALATWIDFDNDGYPDLLLGEALYHNEQGKRFTEVTQRAGLYFEFECMGAVTADYDGDGLLDLYVLYQRDEKREEGVKETWIDESKSGKENVLWRNVGGGRFMDVTRRAKAGGGRRFSHAASWFFYDEDRWPDLYIANDFGRNVILRNKGDGTFADVSERTAASDFATSMGVATGDLNNDGFAEIYVANMYSKMGRRIIGQVQETDYPAGIFQQIKGSCAGNRLYRKHSADGPYSEHGEPLGIDAVGWAYAPALADLDNDGWLDIYATTGFMSFDRQKPDG